MKLCILALLHFLLLASVTAFAAEPRWTLSVEVGGKRLVGFPLEATESNVALLLRDGRVTEFAPSAATDFRKISSTFQPVTAGEMRAELLRELSPALEVTGTGHYLVAHPKGQGGKWAGRFEELYRSMTHYFTVRGFAMREPEFPLAAIVWSQREDFVRYAISDGFQPPPGVVGYYSPVSNRITLYDMAAGSSDPEAWRQSASTIVHEATHQTAFNTHIHTRFAETPKWIVEGLGTLFEVRGVWDSRQPADLSVRVNRDRLENFRQYQQAGRPTNAFIAVVADERLFSQAPLAAYAESWALSFYLSEKLPRKYCELLAKTAALEPFAKYATEQRVADFKAIIGSDLKMFEANYLRFIDGLK